MLRIVSWNVNGIRRPLQTPGYQVPSNCSKALRHILEELDADIVCLQETKVTRDALTEPLAVVEGYNSYFSFSRSQRGYSGVATFCKDSATPVAAEEGLSGLFAIQNGDVGCYGNMTEFTQEQLRALDSEGRALLTHHKICMWEGKEKPLTLINMYCLYADPGKLERLTFKMHFYHLLQIRAEVLLAAGCHVIILGDVNTAHRPIDHYDAGSLDTRLGLLWIATVISIQNRRAFTCWSMIAGACCLNYGARLGYVLGDRTLIIDTLQAAFLLPEVKGSDHCPVGACPALCTSFFPEFSGTQLKILGFLVPHKQEPTWGQQVPQPSRQIQVQKQKAQNHRYSSRLEIHQGGSRRCQKNLMNYFLPSNCLPRTSPDVEFPRLPLVGTLGTPKTPEEDVIATTVNQQTKISEVKDKKVVQILFWKSVLSHRESCVMQIVKKPGPNMGRHFYICARPQGPPNDPSSSCNFFLWSRPS
ncbi:Apex2 [Phodopus roborovskii]|uniref:DNA-(apurinic or apyrimidinic site) endonuclease 2 n=1 Tax=Phodopus roborovskii TaxID=109678 RepID=A0AAU9ZWM6_PHORO|nr:Apex2 [Phodopus roborovskii]